ncbi:MAG TPA: gamma-glutamylcyclotransferase [Gammaproteobacteria bacterium]|nr:gamma-glutamylcyclotransferase [Gammaproteobacteria bacterium]
MRSSHSISGPRWLFAYGSLIWRPGFKHHGRQPARLAGWSRRFWQASTDHRGTPDKPGRVVTLIEHQTDYCDGVAYRLPRDRGAIIDYLDHREKGGYARRQLPVQLTGPEEFWVNAIVYIGDTNNPHYTGPESIAEIVSTIATASGPSGANRDYCEALSTALRQEGIVDDHIDAVATTLANQRLDQAGVHSRQPPILGK